MACAYHYNQSYCVNHTNAGGSQPCPSNVFSYAKAAKGNSIISDRITKIRAAIVSEETRRSFANTAFTNDSYVGALIRATNLTAMRAALDRIVDTSGYCWCNCNYSCSPNTTGATCKCNCNHGTANITVQQYTD